MEFHYMRRCKFRHTTGADVKVDYTNGGQANLTFNNMGKHTGSDQAWTIKAAIYNEAATKGELQNLSFKIYGPKELIGETIKIKCCPEEYVNGAYSNDIYEKKNIHLKGQKMEVRCLIIHFHLTQQMIHMIYCLA